ncbi:N-acetylmuramoyl-L-alanine amidase [Lachnospiraceae bacterium XBB1006]|nr:N-acetylmuramoyl-L-alanine amidase [Lachnospiraceae bacterium XBB1006]
MQKKKRKTISQADKQEWMLGLFALILTCLAMMAQKPIAYTEGNLEKAARIVIDPGHGGKDPGKIAADGTKEKELNLQVAEKLAAALKKRGYQVILTRTKDVTATGKAESRKNEDMAKRIACIKKAEADICVSIHMNSYEVASAWGAQVFYYEKNSASKMLGEQIQESIRQHVCPENGRSEAGNTSYFLLKNSPCPAIIVECGFLSNPLEAEKLKDNTYQKKLAEAICYGILNYFTSETLSS